MHRRVQSKVSKTENNSDNHQLVSLQKICWKSKPFEALDASHDKNFLLKHEAFVDPSYVIQVSNNLFSLSQRNVSHF